MNRSSRLPDVILLLLIATLIVIGLIILSSASTVIGFLQHHDSLYFLKQQALSMLFGIVVFLVMLRIDYRFWRRFSFPLFVLSVILLVAVFIPGIGRSYLGAHRWISIGPRIFQPAEIVKLTFLIYLADWLDRRGRRLTDRLHGLWPFLTLVGTVTLLIVRQPDIGTMAVIGIIAVSSYFVAGAPLRDLTLIAGILIGGFVILLKTATYRAARFLVFLNPQLDPQGVGYHINQALLAIGSGGLFGLGLGHSLQKYNYLPEVAGDSIFAIAAEELGFFLAVGIIVLFIAFMFRGFLIAKNAPDGFGKILATGITTWFGFQALVNIAALSGILPLTGIPLPFISYGGSSMVTSLAAVGILANISRHMRHGT